MKLRLAATALTLAALFIAGQLYGYLRAAVAIAMFVAILWVGIRSLRSIANAPPEPEVTDVGGYGLKYVCSDCGLELKLEVAAHDKAPRHCMEPMVLVREGGRAPLRPVK